MRFDLGQFDERAAICEFDGGLSRFDAETLAAKEQGLARWQAVKFAKEARDAQRGRIAGGDGHQANALAGKRDAHDMPELLGASEEKARSVSERQPEDGRDSGELLSLRARGGEAVQR